MIGQGQRPHFALSGFVTGGLYRERFSGARFTEAKAAG